MICLAFVEWLDPALLATCAAMVAALACGAIAIWLTCRWFRNLKQRQSIAGEALVQLVEALEQEGDLKPEEVERVRTAIARQQAELVRRTK
jgi:hypothetical protein